MGREGGGGTFTAFYTLLMRSVSDYQLVENTIQYTEYNIIYRIQYFIQNTIIYIEYNITYRIQYYIQNTILYTEYIIIYRIQYYIQNKIQYIKYNIIRIEYCKQQTVLCNENTILSTKLNMICEIENNILYAGSAVNNFKELKNANISAMQ